jgi:hypothetical protein
MCIDWLFLFAYLGKDTYLLNFLLVFVEKP